MLRISPNYTNTLATINKPTSNPIRQNSLSFKGNIDGANQDTFTRSTNPKEALPKNLKAEYVKALEQTGYSAFEQKDYKACIASLEEALEINPESARAWHAKASAEKELGLYEEAIQDYTRAFTLRPDSANSIGLRGLSKARYAHSLQKQDPEKAKELYISAIIDYSKSLEIKPNPDFYDLKANVLMITGRYEEAVKSLDESILLNEAELEKQPDNKRLKVKLGDAHHKKGICLYAIAGGPRSNVNIQARDEFSKAIQYVPNSANSYYERARVNRRIDIEEAKADIEKAIEMAPKRAHYYRLLGDMLVMSDNEEERQQGFDYIATSIKLKQEEEQ